MDVARCWISAGLIPELGSGWRSLRRKFGTELTGAARRDLAHLDGWKSAQTILKCYKRDDEATLRAALADGRQSTAVG